MSLTFSTEQQQIRDSVMKLCQRFDDQYWLDRDSDGVFPEDFCQALVDDGWMGIAMPQEYGGSGLGITEAAIMAQAITESGAGNAGFAAIAIGIFGLNPVVVFGGRVGRCDGVGAVGVRGRPHRIGGGGR